MKLKDIAKQYGIDQDGFHRWLSVSGVNWSTSFTGAYSLDDGQDIGALVTAYKTYAAQEQVRLAQEQADAEEAARIKQAALASMLITSGFTFDGYTITRYSGYISGDDAVQIPRGRDTFWGSGAVDVGAKLMESLVTIRRNALAELKEAAFALGCNAVIGVDFDYLTLDPQIESTMKSTGTRYLPYVFGVTANGNAVVIESNGPAVPGA